MEELQAVQPLSQSNMVRSCVCVYVYVYAYVNLDVNNPCPLLFFFLHLYPPTLHFHSSSLPLSYYTSFSFFTSFPY